ncbi:MAG: carboxylating nicotinate-nucleotide diphosphorylase [Enterobacterales bacterium]|nr:carboxylating nicotinate-nucleotide diphosphorylase [Enterobacterales bacterium]
MKQRRQKLLYLDQLNQEIENQCGLAVEEDLKGSPLFDISASLIAPSTDAKATIISRENAIVCGQQWVERIFKQLDKQITLFWHKKDGEVVNAEQVICEISGNARAMLTAERSAMNFLQTLSATATTTNVYVKAMANDHCQLLDTRKTIPGMRFGQKYAVLCGGGKNHRLTLTDRFLIKENHIVACGGIASALHKAKAMGLSQLIEIEVESIKELEQAIDGKPDIIMLDNFTNDQLLEAVRLKQKHSHNAILEASGNVNLKTIAKIAETGVDCISVGAITKNIAAIDLSMRIKLVR